MHGPISLDRIGLVALSSSICIPLHGAVLHEGLGCWGIHFFGGEI